MTVLLHLSGELQLTQNPYVTHENYLHQSRTWFPTSTGSLPWCNLPANIPVSKQGIYVILLEQGIQIIQ